jgi:hypothetical protein
MKAYGAVEVQLVVLLIFITNGSDWLALYHGYCNPGERYPGFL